MLQPREAAPWWIILASVALWMLLLVGAFLFVYHPGTTAQIFLVYLVALLGIIGGLLLGVARLRPRDLGLRRATLLPGLLWTLVAWLALQIIAGAASLLATGRLVLNTSWGTYGVAAVLGVFLFDQLLGNSLFEETLWRGFLLPQLELKFERVIQRPLARWVVAILVSQALFALSHLPSQLFNRTPLASIPFNLLPLWLLGILLAVIYLRTGNLALVIGLHALNDAPLLLFTAPEPLSAFISTLPLFGCFCIIAARWLWTIARSRPAQVDAEQLARRGSR